MRILIATVTAGGGHLAAAGALEEGWRAFRPKDMIERLDVLKFFAPLHRKIYAEGYLQVADHAPEVWGMMFKKTDDPELARRLVRLKRALPSVPRKKFAGFLEKFKADAVLCTHYLPLETLGWMRSEVVRRTSKPGGDQAAPAMPVVASIVTDFEAHALWMDSCVDLYCVAAESTKARLVARGAARGSVLVSGIPISARFSAKVDPAAVRKTLGLRDDLPVLLVLSGGFGMGPVGGILENVDKADTDFQIVVVAGRNEELRRELASQDRKHPTRVLGFASNMHELMAVADLITSKPGGLTTSEALAMGKPLLIFNPIPGQEAANSDFLLEHGAAVKVNRLEDLAYRVEQLFTGRKLLPLSRAARSLGKPDAARDICAEIAGMVEARGAV